MSFKTAAATPVTALTQEQCTGAIAVAVPLMFCFGLLPPTSTPVPEYAQQRLRPPSGPIGWVAVSLGRGKIATSPAP